MRCPNPTTRCNKKSQEKSKSGHDAPPFLETRMAVYRVRLSPAMRHTIALEGVSGLKGTSVSDFARAMTSRSCSRSALDELQGQVWVEEDRFPCWREP